MDKHINRWLFLLPSLLGCISLRAVTFCYFSLKVSHGFWGSRRSGKSGFAAYPSIAIFRR